MGAEILEFPEIAQKHNCEGSTVPLASPAHRDQGYVVFSKPDEK